MHIDTAGTYTLQYTATDSCGNETIEEREVIVGTKRTVFYHDGTLIINELPKDRADNIARHGVEINEYVPMDENNPYVFATAADALWNDVRSDILHIEIGENLAPTSLAHWFRGCTYAQSISNLDKLDISQITSLSATFLNCERLISVDVSTWDTSHATTMGSMFGNCKTLQTLDLSTFDTSSVTNMLSMFNGCEHLASVNVSGWDTSHVTTMGSMFNACHTLGSLDLSSFATPSLTTVTNMFKDCMQATSITFGQNFNTSNVTSLASMFSACEALTSLDITMFNTRNVKSFNNTFSYCRSIEVLDLSSFSSRSLTGSNPIDEMFNYCQALKTIYTASTFTIASANGTNPFGNMSTNLVGGAGTVWDPGFTDKSYGHVDGGTADPGYFTAKP